jgi:maleylpyruvate isomerase
VAVPHAYLTGCRAAHARLEQAIGGLTDEQARRPSLLPGWTVGHVLTHIARNADSVVRRLEGAVAGEVVPQYPGGFEGRAAEIEAGAGRSAAELIADVVASDAAVDELAAAVAEEVWDRPTVGITGVESPASFMLFSRWREVEVHHVDLGLGYQPSSWPPELAEAWLPDLLAGLPGRADPVALLAWLIERGDAPELGPWT